MERAKDFNIILDDVSITDLSFGREYTAAVEAKQVGACSHQSCDALCASMVHTCSSTRGTTSTVSGG